MNVIARIVSKEKLGEDGYCHSIRVMKTMEKYQHLLGIASKEVPGKKIISTSMTGMDKIAYSPNYPPTFHEFDEGLYANVTDPSVIFDKCLQGKDNLTPDADIVIFNKNQNIALLVYSKIAGVIVFENDTKIAAGPLLNSALETNGKYLMEEAKRHLGNDVKVTVVFATDFDGYLFSDTQLFLNTNGKAAINILKEMKLPAGESYDIEVTIKAKNSETRKENSYNISGNVVKTSIPDFVAKLANEAGIEYVSYPGFINPNVYEGCYTYEDNKNNAILIYD